MGVLALSPGPKRVECRRRSPTPPGIMWRIASDNAGGARTPSDRGYAAKRYQGDVRASLDRQPCAKQVACWASPLSGMKGGMGLARRVFWAGVLIALGAIYLWLVVFLGSFVASAAVSVVSSVTQTHSKFILYGTAALAFLVVAVLITLFFIGFYKALLK